MFNLPLLYATSFPCQGIGAGLRTEISIPEVGVAGGCSGRMVAVGSTTMPF